MRNSIKRYKYEDVVVSLARGLDADIGDVSFIIDQFLSSLLTLAFEAEPGKEVKIKFDDSFSLVSRFVPPKKIKRTGMELPLTVSIDIELSKWGRAAIAEKYRISKPIGYLVKKMEEKGM